MNILFPDGHEEEIEAGGRPIDKILIDSGINPLEVLISLDGEIIPEDTIGTDTMSIRLIRISHGG